MENYASYFPPIVSARTDADSLLTPGRLSATPRHLAVRHAFVKGDQTEAFGTERSVRHFRERCSEFVAQCGKVCPSFGVKGSVLQYQLYVG